MKTLCVIPSRIGSTRLARKPLVTIQGKPMIQWVYENARRCEAIDHIVVATDSEEIAAVIGNCGGIAEMTDSEFKTGSDRVAYIANHYPDMDVVINLQGDEPFIKPRMLEHLIAPYLAGKTPDMTTLAFPILSQAEFHDAGIVKVITNTRQQALYFSRAPIPYYRTQGQAPVFHHMGLYAYRRDFLLHFTTLPQTPLELIESLEQLRALENGYTIQVCITEDRTLEINTPEELGKAQSFNYIP